MGSTSNYSWPYPESSDFVADGATAIEDLADAVDQTLGGTTFNVNTSTGRIGIGTVSPDNFVHVKASGTSVAPASVPSTHMIIADAAGANDAGLAVYSSTTGVGYLRFGDSDDSAIGGFSYNHSSNELKIRTNGTDRVTIGSDGKVTAGVFDVNEVRGDNGSVNDPSFTFTDDEDTGIYRQDANSIGFAAGGSEVARLGSFGLRGNDSGDVYNWDAFRGNNGSALSPTFSFDDDSDTGIYRSNTNEISISTGNNTAATFGPSHIDFNRTTYLDARVIFRANYTSNDWSVQPLRLETTYDSGFAARWGNSDSNTGQLRPSAGTWYVRNHNDSAYWTLAAVISNQSSKDEKQDILPWSPPVPTSAGSMVNPEYSTTMSLLNRVDVVSYRWDKQRYCIANETKPDDPNHDDSHVCGVDCDQSPDDPCNYYRNWERGTIGFIAEDLGEIIPQVTNIDRHTGKNTAIDGLAMTAIVVKALQEIDARLTTVENS